MEYLTHLSTAIGIGAIGIIVWGALLSFLRFVILEIRHLRGTKTYREKEILRHQFGSYLLLGLEFLIADVLFLPLPFLLWKKLPF